MEPTTGDVVERAPQGISARLLVHLSQLEVDAGGERTDDANISDLIVWEVCLVKVSAFNSKDSVS